MQSARRIRGFPAADGKHCFQSVVGKTHKRGTGYTGDQAQIYWGKPPAYKWPCTVQIHVAKASTVIVTFESL